MKKLNVLLVGLLTLVLSLVCFSGCFLHQGKYKAVSYKLGSATFDASTESYIELKADDVAVISLDFEYFTLEDTEATWTAGEESNEYVLTTKMGEYTVAIDGGTMIMEVAIPIVGTMTITFEKE